MENETECIVQHEVSKRFRGCKAWSSKGEEKRNGNQSRQSLNRALLATFSPSTFMHTPCLVSPPPSIRQSPPSSWKPYFPMLRHPSNRVALSRLPLVWKYLSPDWKFILRQCLREEETQVFYFYFFGRGCDRESNLNDFALKMSTSE